MQCMNTTIQSSIQKCHPLSRHALTFSSENLAPQSGRHAPCVLLSARTPASHLRIQTSRAVKCTAAAPRTAKLDSSMMWGDIMMLTATELASERLPKHATGVLTLTLIAAWLGAAAAKGDYTAKPRQRVSYQYAYSMWIGMEQAAITWLLFIPTAMAMYAALVSHHLLDSAVFKVPPGSRTSPEGEVMLAALFTLMSWRGIYSSQML